MSLKEKFDKAGLTGTTVALPKGKIKDGSGGEKDYKTSRETKKLVKASQTKDAKAIKTPGALVKGASFANQAKKKKTKANTAADKISGFAGSFLASANANTLGTNAKNVSVLADAIAKSRETAAGVKTPIAATKGSVFVNKGYDPQNAERSLRETQNLESVSGRANAFAQEMAAKERSIDAEAKKNLGTVGGVAYDLGKAGTQLATDAVANILAPGAGLASMGARSFGQGMMTAEEQGKTGARAVAYAAGTAAIEAGTEKISAAAKPLKAIYGAGFVDDALKKLSEKLLGTSKGRQILAEIGRSAAGEGAEEALADVLQVPLQNLALQNGAQFDAEWVADTAYDALLGGVLGGVLGTAGNIGAIAQTRAEGKGNAKADVIAKAMSNATQKNAQKNAPPVFQQAAQEKVERAAEQEAPQEAQQAVTVEQTKQAGTHIEQRTAQSVGERNVKAFQYEHPEVRPFYQTAAEDLLADADLSTQMPAGSRKERTMLGNRYVHTTQASVPLRYAMDMGLTRNEIMRGAEDIINDEGAENNANAKRVELVLDKMLTEGYSTMFGKTADPNAEYIAEKQGIPGYREQAQGEELPIWDMTENDGLGAADRGSLNTPYQNLQEQSSRFYDEGANAARPVDVPMFDANGNPISKSASTVMGAKAIPDDAVPLIEQMIADGQLSYQTVRDRESLARAQETVQKYGFDGAMMEFRKEVNAGKVSKDIMTLGQTLLNSAANNNDGHAVAEILTLYRSINTSAAQALQAASIFRKLDPESQLYGIRRMVDGLNETTRAIKKQYNIEVDPELLNKFTEQTDQAGRDAVMLEIYQNVADQVPATWKEKWDAWRYMAMLTNPRTHIRNIFGNLFFQPVRMLKNGIAAGIESGLSAAGVNIERTKSFGASPELYRACFNDYHNMAQVLGGSKYSEAKSEIEKRRKIFTSAFVGKPLEAVRKFNTAALETEDAVFKRITYADSLAGYLHAHGVTAEQLNSGTADSGVLTAGRNYAAKEAQKATYQDRNDISDKTVAVANALGVVGDAVMPFKRTPANILARGVEYSPIGAAKAVYDGVTKIKSGEKTAAEVIDEAAAGLTGSGLLALGALLLMNGLVTGSQGDDKDDLWAQLLGHQGYALELPGGTSVTIDWLAPASLPFFMGVEMASAVGENGWSAESVWDALKSVANPMLELSMLQSVNDLIDSVKYAEEAPLAAIIPSAIVSYFSQAIPTVGGQVERFGQDTRMTTYTEKDSDIPTDIQYALGRASAKIPGWDYQQIPYIDAWGQEEKTGTPFMRAFNNFLNPSYVSQVEMDKVEKELQKVRDATGDTSVFPNRAEKEVKLESGKKYLTADEYVKYAKQLGKEKYTLLKDAVNSDVYQSMSAAEKADFISYAYKYARNMTEYDQFKRKPDNDWMLEARQSGDVVGAICDRVLYKGTNGAFSEKVKQAVQKVGITAEQYNTMSSGMDADGNGGVSQDEAKAYLDKQDFSRDQKAQLWNIIDKTWKHNPYQ